MTHRLPSPHFLFFPLSISVSPVLLKELITLQIQPLPFQQSLCHLPTLLQKFTAEIIQNIIILDQDFPMRPLLQTAQPWKFPY